MCPAFGAEHAGDRSLRHRILAIQPNTPDSGSWMGENPGEGCPVKGRGSRVGDDGYVGKGNLAFWIVNEAVQVVIAKIGLRPRHLWSYDSNGLGRHPSLCELEILEVNYTQQVINIGR